MTQKVSEEQIKMANKALIDGLFSDDNSLKKKADERASEYMRLSVKESGINRALFDPSVYTGDFDKQLDVEGPAIIFGIEPDVPKVVSIPFSGSTEAHEFYGRKGRLTFSPIQSLKFRKDKYLLLNEPGDIRSWITDKSVFMHHEEEDSRLFGGIDHVISDGTGLPNQTLEQLDEPLWQ